MTFDAFDRLYLVFQILPDDGVGSFEQMLAVDRLREELGFDETEAESINLQQGQGGLSFDPGAMKRLPEKEVELSDSDREAIVFGFKRLEQKNQLPTNKKFIKLYRRFESDIQEQD